MTTEEDTYNRLRRPTYNDMREIWATSLLFKRCTAASDQKYRDFHGEIDAFFESYGWTVAEYSAHYEE